MAILCGHVVVLCFWNILPEFPSYTDKYRTDVLSNIGCAGVQYRVVPAIASCL